MHEYTPSSHDNDPFSEAMLKRVEIIESLPHDIAFEQCMYKHRAVREAQHVMEQPLYVPPDMLRVFPDALEDAFSTRRITVEDLTISQKELADEPTSVALSFTADGRRHELQSHGELATYTTESMDGTPHFYAVPGDTPMRLIAALLYTRVHADDNKDKSAPLDTSFLESGLTLPRDNDTNQGEAFIKALGDLDGRSTITTHATFNADSGILLAKLVEIEVPRYSAVQSRLELTRLGAHDDVEAIIAKQDESFLSQHIVNVGHLREESRFAENYDGENVVWVDPKADYPEWAKLCDEFLTVIEPELPPQDTH